MLVNFDHCTKSNLETYKLIISATLYITNAAVQKLLQRFQPFPSDQRVPSTQRIKTRTEIDGFRAPASLSVAMFRSRP